MKCKSFPLSITALVAGAGFLIFSSASAGPVPAQTGSRASAQATQSNEVQAGEQSENSSSQNPQAAVNLGTITVSGSLRASLHNAQSLKRFSPMISDSVVADAIGKLPDTSVADALQRIPGVQVAPNFQSENATVVVRGLPNVVTTLNGRKMYSGVGRSFAFQNLPATAVKALTVYKSSNASLPAGGIAGLVNIELYKPFDFEGSKIAATFTETHSKYGDRWDPNASLLLSNRWQTSIGEIGALINVGYWRQHYDYNAVWGDFPKLLTDGAGNPIRTAEGNLVAAPNGWGADYNIGDRKRGAFNYAVQWAPNDQTEIYVEGVWDGVRDHYNQPFFFSFPVGLANPTNLVVSDTCYPNQLTGGQYFGQTICDANGGTWTGNTYAATSTQAHHQWGHDAQNAIGVKWHGENLSLSTDLSHETTSFQANTFIIDTFLKGPITTVWTGTPNDHQQWKLEGAPAANPDNFYLNGLFQTWNNQKATDTAWRADGEYEFENDFFRKLEFGVRYEDHQAEARGSVEISTPPPGGTGTGNITANPNPANQVTARFPNGNYFCSMPSTSALPTHWMTGCYDFLLDNADDIRNLYGLPSGLAPVNPGRFYDIEEKHYAAYLQLGYGGELFGMPFDGLLGVRHVTVKRDLNAFSFDASTGVYTPISDATDGSMNLPNISFNWHLRNDLVLRVDAAKTVTYPNFGALNPSISLNPGTINRAGVASSGNPNLSPVRAFNYDTSLEWYFGPSSYASAAVFYRNIKGYQQSFVTDVTIGGEQYHLSSPQSAGSGFLSGFELTYQQFFDSLPGFGVQLNYTRINGDVKTPQYLGGPVVITPLQNVSEDNGNAVLIYERYGWSARLAYTYRSRFIDGFNQPTVAGVYDEVELPNTVDFSLGYDFNDHFTVVLNATNITGEEFHQYWGDGNSRPRDIRYTDRTIGVGVRVNF